ncbi:MAG TPA: hypothetical protein DIW24_07160 [Bacteroidetes bacterium]|nr:hypothetical protein [Bacteroidota bacterium]
MSNDSHINFQKEAFLMPWNLTFLISAMAMVLGTMIIAPGEAGEFLRNMILLSTFGAELMYLGIMPKDKRFQRAVRSRINAEMSKQANTPTERLKQLSRSSLERYVRLKKYRDDIASNYKKLSTASQSLLDSHVRKIEGLMDSYLTMLHTKERYNMLQSDNRELEIARAIEDLRLDMEDDPPKVRSVKQRRLTILEKSLEERKRLKENKEILDAQMATIEDVIRFIHEQSLSMKDPEGITFQLDTLLNEVEETQASVSELEDVFNSSGSILDGIEAYTPSEATSTGTRVKN